MTIYLFCKNQLERDCYHEFLTFNSYTTVKPEVIISGSTINYPRIRKNCIIITDLTDPRLELYLQMKITHPTVRVLCIGSINMLTRIIYFFKKGGMGFLSYNSSLQELVQSIKIIEQNKNKYYSSEIKSHVFLESLAENKSVLSHREIQVAMMVRNGNSSTEIANMLNLSKRTVDVHRYKLMQKLSANNVATLIMKLNMSIGA